MMRPSPFGFSSLQRAAKVFACLLPTMLLAGCLGQVHSVDPAYVLDNESEKGLLVGSLTYQGPYAAYMMQFGPLDEDESLWVQVGADALYSRVDFDDFGIEGDVFAVELAAGRYAFKSWAIRTGSSVVGPNYELAIPFEIRPGEALYIGNFHIRVGSGDYGIGQTDAEFQYGDFLARDMNLFREVYPDIDPRKIHSGIEKGLMVKDDGRGNRKRQVPLYVPVF